MKKGPFFYCLLFSLVVHLVAGLVFILIKYEEIKKEATPVVVDLIRPLKWGPKTVLPEPKAAQNPKAAGRKTGRMEARALPPVRPMPPQAGKPASPPSAAALPPRPSSPHEARPGPDGYVPADGGEPASAASAPAPPSPRVEPAPPARKKLQRPTSDDLMKYAQADRDAPGTRKGDETVTLDTKDLMYTSYLQSVKRRIELIWKYPETAREDGLQGNLVIRFTISKSGRIGEMEILKSSGYPLLDEAAKRALADADPFNPLPDNWGKDSFTITGTFIYRLYGMYLR